MNKQSKKRHINVLAVTTIAMAALAAVCIFLTVYQLYVQEEGILDVSATQQDAYVQLVLDQINLKENREDEEIINDILSTLDSSANKYWTFSKDKDMLFVKDVIETNRYKGLTAISYYDSESAKDFMQNLQYNKVIHRNITVGEKEYVASGVAFKYSNEEYRLCLLTNKNVILDNNQFMEAKMETIILIGFMLVVVLVTSIMFARKQQNMSVEIREKDGTIEELQGTIGHLNEMFGQKEQYDTRYQLWNKNYFNEFIHKLKVKKVKDVVIVKLHFMNDANKKEFFDKASVILDKKVLRFKLDEKNIVLMFIGTYQAAVKSNIELLLNSGVMMDYIDEPLLSQIRADEYIAKLKEKEI